MASRVLSRRRPSISQMTVVKGRHSGMVKQNIFFQKGLHNYPSLRIPLLGVKEPSPLPDLTGPFETRVSSFSNGLRISSENSAGPCASVCLVVDSGCIYEDSSNYGVSHLLEKMAFGSTKNRSRSRLMQEIQAIGLSISASSARDQMIYTGHGLKTFLPHIVEIIADSVHNAIFEESEVSEKIRKMKAEVESVKMSPQSLLVDNMHLVGYTGDYSRSFFASESSLKTLNGRILKNFVNKNYVANRMVLSACGVDHSDLLAIAGPLFSDLPMDNCINGLKFEYVGGDWRDLNDSHVTHFALAFEVPKGWQNERLANRLTVLKLLLGGGESFSTGGPGKGMHTWLCKSIPQYTFKDLDLMHVLILKMFVDRQVLHKYQQFESINSFSSIYKDTGLFGVIACVESQFLPRAVDIVCKELISMTMSGKVSEQAFERAKNATISSVLMSLESTEVVAEDIAVQVLSYGYRRPVNEFVNDIKNLTLQELQRITSEILSQPLTLVSWGAVDGMPAYNVIANRFSY